MKTQTAAIAILAACWLSLCGCGSNQLETAKVTGTVTLDGKPLAHGTVTFTPERGRAATGIIQSDGSFRLSTYSNGDGVILGMHKIAVSCTEEIPDEQRDADRSLDAGMFPRHRSLIPAKYGDYSTSGLTFEATCDGKNEVRLELSSQIGGGYSEDTAAARSQPTGRLSIE